MTTRKEWVEALRQRYRSPALGDRIKIFDEFVAVTGYHRKHAIRVLREEVATAKAAYARNRLYDEAVRQALTVLWEAADRVCGKRLKALIPMLVDAMERHGHLDLDPVIKTKVLQVSAATIDRVLATARLHIDGQRKRRKGVGAAIRRSIPVRTFADWRDPPPGFFEIDRVAHCGGVKTDGDFVHTLTMTDIASGWTECVAMWTMRLRRTGGNRVQHGQTWLAGSIFKPPQQVRVNRVAGLLLAGVGLAVKRLDARAAHGRGDVPAPDLDAFAPEQVAQHGQTTRRTPAKRRSRWIASMRFISLCLASQKGSGWAYTARRLMPASSASRVSGSARVASIQSLCAQHAGLGHSTEWAWWRIERAGQKIILQRELADLGV